MGPPVDSVELPEKMANNYDLWMFMVDTTTVYNYS